MTPEEEERFADRLLLQDVARSVNRIEHKVRLLGRVVIFLASAAVLAASLRIVRGLGVGDWAVAVVSAIWIIASLSLSETGFGNVTPAVAVARPHGAVI